MKHKIDPRTGRVFNGIGVNRPLRARIPQNNPRTRHGETVLIPEQVIAQMLSSFKDMAGEIGRTIASEMNKNIQPQQQPYVVKIDSSNSNEVTSGEGSISIDESIIDVGLEDQEGFQKGDHSADLKKEEIKTDTNLNQSKSRLQALKGKLL